MNICVMFVITSPLRSLLPLSSSSFLVLVLSPLIIVVVRYVRSNFRPARDTRHSPHGVFRSHLPAFRVTYLLPFLQATSLLSYTNK